MPIKRENANSKFAPTIFEYDSRVGFSAALFSGTPVTTNPLAFVGVLPHIRFQPKSVAAYGWNTVGTMVGIATDPTFAGDALAIHGGPSGYETLSISALGDVLGHTAAFPGGGAGIGVYGASASNYGVYGSAGTGVGVVGFSGGTAGLFQTTDVNYNAAPVVLTISHTLTQPAAPAAPLYGGAGMGGALVFQASDAAGATGGQAAVKALWTDPATATRTSALAFSVVNAGAALAEVARIIPAGLYVTGALSATTGLASTVAVGQPMLSLGPVGTLAAFTHNLTASQVFTIPNVTGATVTLITSANPGDMGILPVAKGGLGVDASVVTQNKVLLGAATAGAFTLSAGSTTIGQVLTLASGGAYWATPGALTDVGTVTSPTIMSLNHASSNTPAPGFGSTFSFLASSDTTPSQPQGAITAAWIVATDLGRKARVTFSANDTAAREGIRIEADGAAARVGLYGVPAVARQTASANATDLASAIALVNNLKAILIAVGVAQ